MDRCSNYFLFPERSNWSSIIFQWCDYGAIIADRKTHARARNSRAFCHDEKNKKMGKDTHNAEDTKEVKRKRERKNSGTRRFQTHDRKRFPKTAITLSAKKHACCNCLETIHKICCRLAGHLETKRLRQGKKAKKFDTTVVNQRTREKGKQQLARRYVV